jgi:hypothetical protein
MGWLFKKLGLERQLEQKLLLFSSVQTSPGAHPASYKTGILMCFYLHLVPRLLNIQSYISH